MKQGTYYIADTMVEIRSIYDEVHALCKDYRAVGAAKFSVETTQADIDFERKKSAEEDAFEGLPVRSFSDEYLETLAVYRKLVVLLLQKDILLFHGSVIAVDGVGYLFTAKSGTGKSTHTKLWRDLFGERAVMINDDKPLIRLSKTGATVYGTPWDGKHRLSTNTSVPLKAICILERGAENEIHPVPMREALSMLFQQCYRPPQPEAMKKTAQLIGKMGTTVGLYRLHCNMNPEAAKVAYEGMQG